MIPPDTLVMATNQALADPSVRTRVRELHAANAPLVEMVEVLGLAGDLTAELRQLLAQLDPEAVRGIREATLAMLDRGEHAMPLDCDVTEGEVAAGTAATIDVADANGVPMIRVRRATS